MLAKIEEKIGDVLQTNDIESFEQFLENHTDEISLDHLIPITEAGNKNLLDVIFEKKDLVKFGYANIAELFKLAISKNDRDLLKYFYERFSMEISILSTNDSATSYLVFRKKQFIGLFTALFIIVDEKDKQDVCTKLIQLAIDHNKDFIPALLQVIQTKYPRFLNTQDYGDCVVSAQKKGLYNIIYDLAPKYTKNTILIRMLDVACKDHLHNDDVKQGITGCIFGETRQDYMQNPHTYLDFFHKVCELGCTHALRFMLKRYQNYKHLFDYGIRQAIFHKQPAVLEVLLNSSEYPITKDNVNTFDIVNADQTKRTYQPENEVQEGLLELITAQSYPSVSVPCINLLLTHLIKYEHLSSQAFFIALIDLCQNRQIAEVLYPFFKQIDHGLLQKHVHSEKLQYLHTILNNNEMLKKNPKVLYCQFYRPERTDLNTKHTEGLSTNELQNT